MGDFFAGSGLKILAALGVGSSVAFALSWIDERLAIILGFAMGFIGLVLLFYALLGIAQQMTANIAVVSTQLLRLDERANTLVSMVAQVDGKATQAADAAVAALSNQQILLDTHRHIIIAPREA